MFGEVDQGSRKFWLHEIYACECKFACIWVAVGVAAWFITEERPWHCQNGQMINDQGECYVGGLLQHCCSWQKHTMRCALLTSLLFMRKPLWPSYPPLTFSLLRLDGDDRAQWEHTMTRLGKWCHYESWKPLSKKETASLVKCYPLEAQVFHWDIWFLF